MMIRENRNPLVAFGIALACAGVVAAVIGWPAVIGFALGATTTLAAAVIIAGADLE